MSPIKDNVLRFPERTRHDRQRDESAVIVAISGALFIGLWIGSILYDMIARALP